MINKIIVDGENVELTDASQVPYTHTFSQANTHTVKFGIDNTDEICAYAFQDCTDLSYITFPDQIVNIKRCAFKNCTSLKALPLSENIKYIGRGAFDGCISLEEIEFKGDTPEDIDVYCTLPSNTNIYVPNGSKFKEIPFEEMVLDGKTEYFTQNEKSKGYDKMRDVTFADENGTYFYNRWQDIADGSHTIEVKNRVPVENIVWDYVSLKYDTDVTVSYILSPANITNNQLHWYSSSENTEIITDLGLSPVVDDVADTVTGIVKLHTTGSVGSRVTISAYAESGVSYTMSLNVVKNS